jgi:hypothetical protein
VYLGVSSPIVEVFVKGSVPRDVRLLAARGMAASVGCDRLALLALMTLDEDPEVSALASATIGAIPQQALSAFFGRDDVPQQLRAWFETSRAGAPPTAEAAGTPDGAASAHAAADGRATPVSDGASADLPAIVDDPLPDDEDEAHQLLTSLPVPDKIKLATLGRREQRAILVRDPNRIVSTAVLSSPKLTDTEVENFARMQNVSDEVLRLIGTSRAWTKSYTVVSALVKNPRTPTAVSMPLLTRLVERDLKGLAVDRNVPESVRLAARKQLSVLESRKS